MDTRNNFDNNEDLFYDYFSKKNYGKYVQLFEDDDQQSDNILHSSIEEGIYNSNDSNELLNKKPSIIILEEKEEKLIEETCLNLNIKDKDNNKFNNSINEYIHKTTKISTSKQFYNDISIIKEKKKRGRPKKENKKKINLYNIYRKIINSCNKKICSFINRKLSKGKLSTPYIKNIIGNSFKLYYKFFNLTYSEIICYSLPKRYKEQKSKNEEIKQNIYKNNKIKLDKIIEENGNVDIIKKILKLKFGDFFEAYLKDLKFIFIKNENNFYETIDLTDFDTFSSCLNEDEDFIKQKEKYKKILLDIKNGINLGRNA